MIFTGFPVVSCPYIPAAEIPIPCWPRLWRSRWNLEPYNSFAKMRGTCSFTIPGPLSVTVTRKRVACAAVGVAPFVETTSIVTMISGRRPASSHASSELSTASLTHVSRAFLGLSNPSRCLFLLKNSETEISRWRAPISTAVKAAAVLFARAGPAGRSDFFGFAFIRLPHKTSEYSYATAVVASPS